MDQVVEVLQRYGGYEPEAAFPEDEPRQHEQRASSGSMAVMCVDGRGRPLFATARALALCARWNQALDRLEQPMPALRLPSSVYALYAAARASAKPASVMRLPRRWSIHHPGCPELVLTVETDDRPPHAGAGDCCLLWLEESALLARLQSLSPSERRVAVLVARGLRNHQIAERLCRSRRTVEFQLNSIYRKLEVSCRTQLVRALL